MKVKRIPNSIKFPEAWKIFIDCVRKWKESDKKKYPAGWKYGIPNPVDMNEYLYSECIGKLFIEFKDLYYTKRGIPGFRNFLWKLDMMEGKISPKEYEANVKFLQRS